jgi:hypothetical protein
MSLELILEEIYKNTKILRILAQLPPIYLGGFLYNIKYLNTNLPSKQQIFPNNISSYKSSYLHKVCEELKNKHSQFFRFISDWKFKNSQEDMIKLIISYNRKIDLNERISHDVHMTIEMLIAYAYHYTRPIELNTTLEYSLGKTFSIYFNFTKFRHEEIARIVDFLTEIFPTLYLPTKNFCNTDEKKNYYEKLLRFYTGLMSNSTSKDWGNIFQHLFSPIKYEFEKLTHEYLIFIEDIEQYFIYPLLKRNKYSNNEVQQFTDNFDTTCNFKDYLSKKRRLGLYGYKSKKRQIDSIYKEEQLGVVRESFGDLKLNDSKIIDL